MSITFEGLYRLEVTGPVHTQKEGALKGEIWKQESCGPPYKIVRVTATPNGSGPSQM